MRKAIAEAEIVFVSAASAREAAIKIALGRLRIPDTIEAGVVDSAFEKLPINFSHTEDAARLPPHNNDPFDRMPIAQAVTEGLTLVTHDRRPRRHRPPATPPVALLRTPARESYYREA